MIVHWVDERKSDITGRTQKSDVNGKELLRTPSVKRTCRPSDQGLLEVNTRRKVSPTEDQIIGTKEGNETLNVDPIFLVKN